MVDGTDFWICEPKPFKVSNHLFQINPEVIKLDMKQVETFHHLMAILDRSQNYAFIWHLVAFHFICITFAFHLHFA